jgi:hypothetical protein
LKLCIRVDAHNLSIGFSLFVVLSSKFTGSGFEIDLTPISAVDIAAFLHSTDASKAFSFSALNCTDDGFTAKSAIYHSTLVSAVSGKGSKRRAIASKFKCTKYGQFFDLYPLCPRCIRPISGKNNDFPETYTVYAGCLNVRCVCPIQSARFALEPSSLSLETLILQIRSALSSGQITLIRYYKRIHPQETSYHLFLPHL